MSTMITEECINCGAYEPECPNTAIYEGGAQWEYEGQTHAAIATDIYYIVPEKCTECGSPYMIEKWLKAGPVLQCPNQECKFKKDLPVPMPEAVVAQT